MGLSIPLFEQFDCIRQIAGRWMDRTGIGIEKTDSRIVFESSGLILRHYGRQPDREPVLLIVPAPIKSESIWDMAPSVSAVRRCTAAGISVYVIGWKTNGGAGDDWGLAEYADRFISDSVATVREETGRSRLFLAGHSLGGTLSAIYASLHPHRVTGLILLAAPLHFGEETGILERIVAKIPETVFESIPHLERAPGSLLGLLASVADPISFGWSRWLDLLACLADPDDLRTHIRVSRWTLDEFPMPGRLFCEIIDQLYREDRFMKGRLAVGRKAALPEAIDMPVACVLDERSRLVPSASAVPFLQKTGSRDIELLWYTGDFGVGLQHVGMLVGRQAHRHIWPAIVDWMHARAGASASGA